MTKLDYNQIPDSDALPVYDAESPSAFKVDRPDQVDSDSEIWHHQVYEANELDQALGYLNQSDLVFKGGIRSWNKDRSCSSICAYFWKKRGNGDRCSDND